MSFGTDFLIFFFLGLIFIIIASLISYYSSKLIVKWIKNIQRIDNRKDLEQSPKLKEIVLIVRKVSQLYKIKMPEIGVYPSQEINAFATGPAGNTLIAFSSNLINKMNLNEIKGVVGHELSHLIHYDVGRILIVQGLFDTLHLILVFLISSWLFQPTEEERKTGRLNIVKWFFKWMLFEVITAIVRLIGVLIVLWYTRKRELAADLRGAKIVGVDNVLASLQKLLEWENKSWVVDGIDLTEDENIQKFDEPNSISLLKFNPEKKKRGLLDLFRTHPTLETRIKNLEKYKEKVSSTGIIN